MAATSLLSELATRNRPSGARARDVGVVPSRSFGCIVTDAFQIAWPVTVSSAVTRSSTAQATSSRLDAGSKRSAVGCDPAAQVSGERDPSSVMTDTDADPQFETK